jgi:hypothetical protein
MGYPFRTAGFPLVAESAAVGASHVRDKYRYSYLLFRHIQFISLLVDYVQSVKNIMRDKMVGESIFL